MMPLTAAALALVLGHVVPSAPPVRRRLIAMLGRAGFFAGYSILSLALLAWVVVAWRAAAGGPALWAPPLWARWVTLGAMPLALWLVVSALVDRPAADRPGRGAFRLTPAPGSLGVMLWAGLHLLSVGSARGAILFGALAMLGLATLIKVLARAGRPDPSSDPSSAPVASRPRRRPAWLAPAGAVALWAGLLALHPWVIGVDPWAARPF